MKLYRVEIEGLSPLLMHRFGEKAMAQLSKGTSKAIQHSDDKPKDIAEEHAYRIKSTKELYIPMEHILSSMRYAGKLHKIGRRSASPLVPAGIFIREEAIGLKQKDYKIDVRTGVNQNTKMRVVIYRPRLDKWKASFTMEVDETIFNKELVLDILTDAGKKIGIGSFRPQKSGSFGRFMVTKYEELK